MFAELFTPEQLTILGQIILIDLVLAGDNAMIIRRIITSIYSLQTLCRCY